MEQQLPQLEMLLPSLASLPEVEVADGYTLRTYRDGDLAVWAQLVSECIGGRYDDAACRESLLMGTPSFTPEDLFFAEKDGEVVGTTCAHRKHPPEEGPGIIHMVGVFTAHRGHGLGRTLVIAALRRLCDLGYREVVLSTDDFRLSALRTYLGLGFRPVFSHPSHTARWEAAYQQLGLAQDT
jgi:mycothiol synthase